MRYSLLPLLACLLLAEVLVAQEQVLVRRLADVVGIREGDPPVERVLYYFAPTAQLVQGDHVEQGSGGQSEIILSAGGLVAMHSSGHAILRRISQYGDVIEFPLLTTLQARALERPLRLKLPGGTACDLENTEVFISIEPGRMRIRNQGGMPIRVIGDLQPRRESEPGGRRGRLRLERGEELTIPLFGVAGVEQEGLVTEAWGALLVQHFGGATVERDGARLLVQLTETPDDATVTIGGVATRPGLARLLIRNPRHVDLPAKPAPVAVDAVIEASTTAEEAAEGDGGADPGATDDQDDQPGTESDG